MYMFLNKFFSLSDIFKTIAIPNLNWWKFITKIEM